MSDTLTLDEIRNLPEDVPQNIESSDYSPYDLIPIGYYLSRQREIVARKSQRTGNLYYEVRFTSGLENPESGRSFGRGKYPEKMFLFGNLRTREGKRGQTSDVAEYLRATGIDPKGITSVADALQESCNRDVMAFVSWTNKTEQVTDAQGNTVWTKEVLRGKDFNTGSVSEPSYVPTIEVEGVRYDARHKVVGFRRVQ